MKISPALREFTQRLSESDRRFLGVRLAQRLSGDLPEVLDRLAGSGEMDRWLASAASCWELYDALDLIQKALRGQRPRMEV
jgi:hypothetical protein